MNKIILIAVVLSLFSCKSDNSKKDSTKNKSAPFLFTEHDSKEIKKLLINGKALRYFEYVKDNFIEGTSQTYWGIENSRGFVKTRKIPGLETGDFIAFKDHSKTKLEYQEISKPTSKNQFIKTAAGEYHLLAIVPNFTDLRMGDFHSQSRLRDRMEELSDYYEKVSEGKIKIKFTLEQLNLNLEFFGNNNSGSLCSLPTISNIMKSKSKKYNEFEHTHVMTFYAAKPDVINKCRFGGVATVGGDRSLIINNNNQSVAHEFGHNLGLRHSGGYRYDENGDTTRSYSSYGDHSCPQGSGYHHFNGYQLFDLNVVKTTTVEESEEFDLEDYSSEGNKVARIKLTDSSGTSKNFYFSLRDDQGLSHQLHGRYFGVNIHTRRAGRGDSQYVATLGTDKNFIKFNDGHVLILRGGDIRDSISGRAKVFKSARLIVKKEKDVDLNSITTTTSTSTTSTSTTSTSTTSTSTTLVSENSFHGKMFDIILKKYSKVVKRTIIRNGRKYDFIALKPLIKNTKIKIQSNRNYEIEVVSITASSFGRSGFLVATDDGEVGFAFSEVISRIILGGNTNNFAVIVNYQLIEKDGSIETKRSLTSKFVYTR